MQNLALGGDDDKEDPKKRFKVVKNQQGFLGLVVLDAQTPGPVTNPSRMPTSDPMFRFPPLNQSPDNLDQTGKRLETARSDRDRRGN